MIIQEMLQLLTTRSEFFMRLFVEHLMICGIAASCAIVIGVGLGGNANFIILALAGDQ